MSSLASNVLLLESEYLQGLSTVMSSLSLLTLDRGIEFSMVKSISGSVKDSRLGNQGFRMLLLSMFSHNFLTPGQSLAQSIGVEGKK